MRESSRILTDLVAAWKDAATGERRRIASNILAMIDAKHGTILSFWPRPSWLPYFEALAEYVGDGRRTHAGQTLEWQADPIPTGLAPTVAGPVGSRL